MQLGMRWLPLGKLDGRDAQGPDVRLQQQSTASYTLGGGSSKKHTSQEGKKNPPCASEVLNKILILN